MMKSHVPKFLSAYHIKDILQISYFEASQIIELNILPVITIGNTKRVSAKDFYKWLETTRVTAG
jgi:hypothetical protein